MKNNDSIIVVPDVHGREFWKSVKDKEGEIVFLGDYIDPYQRDGITPDDAFENFKEVIEFAKSNKDRVHLLLGNHDLHYIGFSDDSCRLDYNRAKELYNLYKENKDLFNIAYRWNNTLFTHAGVTDSWMKTLKIRKINKDNICDILNNLLHSQEWTPECDEFNSLGDIGYSRGGNVPFGSCCWADIEEMIYGPAFYDTGELKQVMGHTQLIETGDVIHTNKNFWMCDSRTAFIWDENELKPLEK